MKWKKHTPKESQQAFDLQTRKSLGQHFLEDKNVIDNIVKAVKRLSDEAKSETCVEIGPGAGALTARLLEGGLKVVAVEKDERSISGLKIALGLRYENHLKLVHEDVLTFDPASVLQEAIKPVLVGNLPYYITSDIMLWYCNQFENFHSAVFMVQDEVADRIAAKTSTKAYGRLSVRMQLFFDVHKLFVVPPGAFNPPPKVNSAVIELRPKGFKFSSLDEDTAFSQFTAKLFAGRRKMLRRVLSDTVERLKHRGLDTAFWEVVQKHGFSPESRPDVLPPELVLAMHRLVYSK